MLKKVTERSRVDRELKNVPKVKKKVKTAAERNREYRARLKALEKAAAGTATQTASQQNLEVTQVGTRDNQRSLLYQALSRQSSQDEQKKRVRHQENLPMLSEVLSSSTIQLQSSSQKGTTLRKPSKTAKTPAERARAYRERKRALKNVIKQQLKIKTSNSHRDNIVEPEDVSQKAINVRTSTELCAVQKQPCKPSSPSTSKSSNNLICDDNCATNRQTPLLKLAYPNPSTNIVNHSVKTLIVEDSANDIHMTNSESRHPDKAHRELKIELRDNSLGCICSVCGRLWFKDNLKNPCVENEEISIEIIPDKSVEEILMCNYCLLASLNKNPAMSMYNGFKFTQIPTNF